MALTRKEPGLWVDETRSSGGPGVHALIIGVSRYDHLAGGSAPAPETYGLGQLSASALTAYRFFTWLGSKYALNGWPVARVRLLMSPLRKGVGNVTADELEGCDAATCNHAPEATFANCVAAIENWYADMRALPATATGRSLFFFSGHGMEPRKNHQVLLPANYLRPPTQPLNEAISTYNLLNCLEFLPRVASHVLLLDGCRNDIDKLQAAEVKGTAILNENSASATNPLFEKAVLYSTAAGLRAYSPKAGGLSLFGQALLDGLSNKPDPVLDEVPIKLTRRGDVYAVEVDKLAGYMNRRVDALIRAANESVVQVVRSTVDSFKADQPIEIAEIAIAQAAAADGRRELDISGFRTNWGLESLDSIADEFMKGLGDEPHERDDEPPARDMPSPDAWFAQRYRPPRPAAPLPSVADATLHVGPLHDILGSEAVTFPWLRTLKVTGLSTRQSTGYDGVQILSSAQADKTSELHRVQVHFRIAAADPVGHVMTIMDKEERRFCCVLPADKESRIFQLEIDVERENERAAYIRVASYLSPQNDGPTGQVALAWEQMRAVDPGAGARQLDANGTTANLEWAFAEGEQVMVHKLRAPLGAAVATVLLLKGNRFDRLHDWARNVANWFPWIPDGVVLWTEQCRRMAKGQPLDAGLLPWFVTELSRRSLPFTADGFGLAADIVADIVRGRLKTDPSTRAEAMLLTDRIKAAEPYFRDNGLFCTYAGWPEDWDAAKILGPPAA